MNAGASNAGTGGTLGGEAGQNGGFGGDPAGGAAGSGELFPGDRCNFAVEHTQSSAIGTVTIVSWSTDFGELDEAHIDFGPADSDFAFSAPVDLEQAGYRTLLLGMKAGRGYRFRIVAARAGETCTSPAFDVTTAPLPENVPTLTKSEPGAGGVRGFLLTTPGIAGSLRGFPSAYVFDTDGDVVWWTPDSVEQMSSARMSWDGQAMWVVNANGGALYRTSMDGLSTQSFSASAVANHDVAPLPGGGVATFGRVDGGPALIEVTDDGSVEPIALLADLYDTGTAGYHANAVTYLPADDTFIVGDLNLDGFVKLERNGELIWQLGGLNPKGDAFDLAGLEPWNGNHGLDVGPDGQFLFFNNFPSGNGSLIIELALDEDSWTATKTWEYAATARSQYLGGVQRLPNGNTLVVLSQGDAILEANEASELVQSFTHSAFNDGKYSFEWAVFGYANYRATLYGPPASSWPD